MLDWPANVPFLAVGFKMTPVDGAIRTPTSAGPGKDRQRFSEVPINVTSTVVMTGQQFQTVWEFYKSDLGMGTLPFLHDHPITGAPVTWMFTAPPEASGISSDGERTTACSVSIAVEILP